MAESFSLSTAVCTKLGDPSLREEIQTHTESPEATDQILRALLRFGIDPTIERFEVTPQANRGGTRVVARFAWSVKAVRAARPEPPVA
jgi:hypothetical protein